jgi:hypothetical protein
MADVYSKSLALSIETNLPKDQHWCREDYCAPGDSDQGTAFFLESEASNPPRRLEIELRSDGDVDVRFHLTGISGSPFEAHFIVYDQDVSDAQDAVTGFVQKIIDERLVCAQRKGFFTGRDGFISAADLEQQGRSNFKFVASWTGTFDHGLIR